MRGYALTLLLLTAIAAAACGGSDGDAGCPWEKQTFLFDGEEAAPPSCGHLRLGVTIRDGATVPSSLSAGYQPGRPEFYLEFIADDAPASFPVAYDQRLRRDAEAPWATSIFYFWDESGPLRATGGTGTFVVDAAGRATVAIEGTIARRDGVERPFTARLEGMLEVECDMLCGYNEKPCPPDETALCEGFLALSSWSPPARD